MNPRIQKLIRLFFFFFALFLGVRYLLPLIFPFLVAAVLALAAEPIVRFLCVRLRLCRSLASCIGVAMSFSFLVLVILLLLGFAVRELRELSGILPELENAVRSGMGSLSDWLLSLAGRSPQGIRSLLTRNVTSLFSSGSALLDRATDFLLRLASGILSQVPDSALGLGTAIIASFMISAKLPKLRELFRRHVSAARLKPLLDVLKNVKSVIAGWLKAQLKLACVTFLVSAAGLFLLKVPYAPLWAALLCIVDAFPILGTGTVLVPWSIVSFLQGDRVLAFGLLALYGAAVVTRSVLEPRLVGKQLGLDPLVTLIAFYVGYRLFGLPGMLLSPMVAVTAAQLIRSLPASDS